MDDLKAKIIGKKQRKSFFFDLIANVTPPSFTPPARKPRKRSTPKNSLERKFAENAERRAKAASDNFRRLENLKTPARRRRKRKLKPCKAGYARNPATRRCKKAERSSSLLFPRRKARHPFHALKYKNRGIFAISKKSGAVYKCQEKKKRKCTVAGGKKWWIGNPRKATGSKQAALKRRLPGAVLKKSTGR